MLHDVGNPVQYRWELDGSVQSINDWLGRRVRISFCGEQRCIACGKAVKRLYQNGYCFPCVTTLAETDLCIVKPHECHLHLGTCRDETFAATHCTVPHTVYLGVSSHAKVGLTRKHREFTRWLDQGAIRATAFAEVPTRRDAGMLEMEIAAWLPDKTNWRKMVCGEVEEADLAALAEEAAARIDEKWSAHVIRERVVHEFNYPVLADRETRPKSLSLERAPVEGLLVGARGQYLLFEEGVVNIRKHAGMLLEAVAND